MDDQGSGHGVDKPRSPDEQELTGTGTPRSADNGFPQSGGLPDAPDDPAVTTGMRSTSDPARSDEVTINRSGSGGSGGPAEQDESVEGSGGQSMSELLGGEDETEPRSS
jgi:hypothetical protein